MSSTSKDINQYNIDYLVLDLGLYSSTKDLRQLLVNQQEQNNNVIIMDLNTKLMSTAEWDAVLDNILKAKRCITL